MSAIELTAFVFSVLGFTIAAWSLIEVKAMQRSTHKVQLFNPANQEFTSLTDEQKKVLSEEVFDNL